MNQGPTDETVPASVNKYLLPNELHVTTVREHPAVLLRRTFLVLAGLALAGWLSSSVAHGNSTTILVIWILWGILLLWLGAKIWDWAIHYFILTSKRLMLAQGVILRKVNFIPLDKVTDVEFRRTTPGRLLGYGELEIMSPGQDEEMRHIRFVPYPEQLYLEVCGLIFKEGTPPRPPPTGDVEAVAAEFSRALTRSLDQRDREFFQLLSRWLDQRDQKDNRDH